MKLRDRTDRVIAGVAAVLGLASAVEGFVDGHLGWALLMLALGGTATVAIVRDHRRHVARRSADTRPSSDRAD